MDMARRPSERAAHLAAEVVAWRHDRLRRAGVPHTLAGALASEGRMDLHALIELLERGCPPALAARILAPTDVDPDDAWPLPHPRTGGAPAGSPRRPTFDDDR